MLSFVEHVVLVSEVKAPIDHRKSMSRSGGPGTQQQEKDRHAKKVRELRQKYQDLKAQGFRSPEERSLASARHRLARRTERLRHRRSLGGHSMQ